MIKFLVPGIPDKITVLLLFLKIQKTQYLPAAILKLDLRHKFGLAFIAFSSCLVQSFLNIFWQNFRQIS